MYYVPYKVVEMYFESVITTGIHPGMIVHG